MFGSSAPLAIGPALYPNSATIRVNTFVPIALFSERALHHDRRDGCAVQDGAGVAGLRQANPGRLNFGVPNGAPPHMLAEMFRMKTGADI